MASSTVTSQGTSNVAIFSIADIATPASSGSALWEIRTSSSNQALILEIGLSNAADITPSAEIFGFGVPAARGVTPTSPKTVLPEDTGGPAGTVQTATAWTTAPTAPTTFLRRQKHFHFMFTQWAFPRGITMPVSASLVLWTLTVGTATAHNVYVVDDE